ncbi:MAG: V-type ATP synthase subunit I, partial [Treponema sp.]|nr:V-type ATP synthase subunit I [Treponema sp.]
MIRPRKMKQIEMTVLTRDVDSVIEYLGRRALMHFSGETLGEGAPGESAGSSGRVSRIRENLDRLRSAAVYLGVELPGEAGEDGGLPQEADERLTDTLIQTILGLAARENEQTQEKKKLEETLNEAQAFSRL